MAAEAVPHWQRATVALGAITDPLGPRPALRGSGFIIDAEAGILATCAHVIEDLQRVNGFSHIAVGFGSRIEYLGLHDRLDLPHRQSPVRWRERRRRRGGGSESIANPAQAQAPQPARRRQPVPSEQATAWSIQSSTADPATRGQRNARARDRPPLA